MGDEFTEKAIQTAEKAREAGLPRLRKVNAFYDQCLRLITGLEEEKHRAEQLKDRDLVVRNKHARKIAKTVKKVNQLFHTINNSFLRGEIKEEEGKAFAEALRETLKEGISSIARPSCSTCHVSKLKLLAATTSRARKKLGRLDELILLYREFEEQRSQLRKRVKEAQKELKRAESEISSATRLLELKKQAGRDRELVGEHEKALSVLASYDRLRRKRLEELRNKPAAKVIEFFLAGQHLEELGFPAPEDASALLELKSFLEKDLAGLSVEEVVKYSSFNDKKLSHYTPEPSTFRRLVERNATWLSRVSRLEDTGFLAVSVDDENARFEKIISCLGKNEASSLLSQALETKKSLDLSEAREAVQRLERTESLGEGRVGELEKEKKEIGELLEGYEKLQKEYSKEG